MLLVDLVATSQAVAATRSRNQKRDLLAAALSHNPSRDVVVDAPELAPEWVASLGSVGFVRQRTFLRMCLGRAAVYGKPWSQYAIAGPELG